MGNVVTGKFNIKKEYVLECCFCNEGQQFWVNEDGTITCIPCGSRQKPPREWMEKCMGEIIKEEQETEEED